MFVENSSICRDHEKGERPKSGKQRKLVDNGKSKTCHVLGINLRKRHRESKQLIQHAFSIAFTKNDFNEQIAGQVVLKNDSKLAFWAMALG